MVMGAGEWLPVGWYQLGGSMREPAGLWEMLFSLLHMVVIPVYWYVKFTEILGSKDHLRSKTREKTMIECVRLAAGNERDRSLS